MHNALLVSSTTTSSRHPWPIHKVLAQNLDLFQLPFHLFRGLLSGPVVSTLLGLGRNSYTSERLGYVPQHKRYSRRLTEMRGPTVDLSTPFRPTQSHGRWNLVNCLLSSCTAISLLLNSFSSLRIAACDTKGKNNRLVVFSHPHLL